MRKILLATIVLLVPRAAVAQKVGDNVRVPYSVFEKRFARIVVIAQDAELRDGTKVIGKVTRGDVVRVEETAADRYQVRWEGKSVWIKRADVLPFDRGIDYFTAAIRQHSTGVDYIARGRIRQYNGDLDGALDDYNQAIRLDSTKSLAYHCRGFVWHSKGDLDQAIADFDTAIHLDPKDAYAYSNRAIMFHEKGDSVKAIRDYDTAIRLDPMDSTPYYSRGVVWESQGDLDKAIIDYTSAIRLDPKMVAAYVNRGNAFKRKGEFDKAMADYDEAIRLDPGLAMVFNKRGLLWASKADLDKAMVDFDEAIRLDPTDAFFPHNNRGQVLCDKGEFDKALVAFDKAIHLAPTYADAYCHRAELRAACRRQRIRDGKKALADATTACKLTSGEDARALSALAAAYAELGEFAKAVQSQQQALKFAPKGEMAEFQSRLVLYQAGKPYRWK